MSRFQLVLKNGLSLISKPLAIAFTFLVLFAYPQLIAQTAPSFSQNTVDASFDNAAGIFPADINNDGHMDIVAFSQGSTIETELVWYKHNGAKTPSYSQIEIYDSTLTFNDVHVVDLDDDGDLDIVAALQADGFSGDSNVFWFENDGAESPSFTPLELGSIKGKPSAIDVADIDDDGDLDVAVSDHDTGSAGFSSEAVTWFENDGASDPEFTKIQIDVTFLFSREIKIGDLDGDGDLDIVADSDEDDKIYWYENDGASDPSFTKNTVDPFVLKVSEIGLGDIDGDGDQDIIFTDRDGDYISYSQNDGASDPSFTEVSVESSVDAINLALVEDLDLDGDLDIISGSPGLDSLFWYENDGASLPSFTRHALGGELVNFFDVEVADIDGDGSPDILASSITLNDILWFNNDLVTINPASVILDGDNDYISIPTSVSAALGDNASFTVETWVKPDYNNQTESLGALLAINTASYGNVLLLTIDNGASANSGQIRVLDNTGDVLSFEISSSAVGDNQWVHVAYSLSGTTGTLYINGEMIGTHTQDTPVSSDDIWSFGQDFDPGPSGGNYLKAQFDELRIWNTARTQNQIRENLFQSLKGDETSLIGYWPLDEINDFIAYDKTSDNYTANLENGAVRSTTNNPYGTFITGNEGWRMMTSPVSNISYGVLLDTLWTQGFTGSDSPSNGTSNVYVWSESSQSFSSISNATDIPADGAGFIMYVYDDDNFDGSGDGFPKVIQTDSAQRTGTLTPSLSYTDTGNSSDDGWNLIGNPYGASIDWDASSGLSSSNLDASFYIWSDSANSGAGAYLSWNGTTGTFGSGTIAPWQGFWVKANATSPSLTITDNSRSGGGILHKQAPVSQLEFMLKGQSLSSKTVLMLSNSATVEKDPLDAYKLASLNADYLSLFTQLEDGTGMDINALPLEMKEPLSIPLNFDGSNLGGEYTLTWSPQNPPEGMQIILIDSETDTEVDLTEASSFNFEIENKAKVIQSESEESTLPTTVPVHAVFSPKVIKAKASGSRFTIQINTSTSVNNEPNDELPSAVELEQNYPNPFNPSTTIQYGVPESGKVTLEVFDVMGRKVATLVHGETKSAGRYAVQFNASQLASGMYIYRLQAGSQVFTRKLTLIK